MTLSLPSFRHLSIFTPFPLKSCGNISRNFTLQRKDTSSPCPNGKYSYQHQVPVESLSYARCWATATRGYLATGYPPSISLAGRNLIFHRVFLSSSARRGCLYCAAPLHRISLPSVSASKRKTSLVSRAQAATTPLPRKTQANAGEAKHQPSRARTHTHSGDQQLAPNSARAMPPPSRSHPPPHERDQH